MSTVQDTTRGGIYQIRNLVNGKVYIGSAVHIGKRWVEHLKRLRNGSHHSRHLQAAWNKHGADQFILEVVEVVEDLGRLIEVEQEHLDRIRPFDKKTGYNISPTAGSSLGIVRSDETKAKLSEIAKKQFADPEARAKSGEANKGNKYCVGRVLSDETKAKLSEAAKKQMANPEMKAALMAARDSSPRRGGRPKGVPLTPEQKAKIAEATRARMADPELRARLSAKAKARVATPEGRANMLKAVAMSQPHVGRDDDGRFVAVPPE